MVPAAQIDCMLLPFEKHCFNGKWRHNENHVMSLHIFGDRCWTDTFSSFVSTATALFYQCNVQIDLQAWI